MDQGLGQYDMLWPNSVPGMADLSTKRGMLSIAAVLCCYTLPDRPWAVEQIAGLKTATGDVVASSGVALAAPWFDSSSSKTCLQGPFS